MKTKLLLLAAAAILVAVASAPGRSQDAIVDGLVHAAGMWADATSGLCSAPVGPRYAEDLSCSDGTCGQCNCCCRQCDIFGSVEYLMWWAKGTHLPPLVTTSDPGTPQSDAGVLGLPTTTILFGNEFAGKDLQAGGRVALGLWLDCDHNAAFGGRFFGLGGDTTQFVASSDGSTILARPFFNAFLGVDDALLIAFPGLAAGSVNATLSTQNILGTEVFAEMMMLRDPCRRVDLVAGYQFLRLDDRLEINSNHTLLQANLQFDITDRFKAYNQFHGGEIGIRGQMYRGCWSVDALAQIAVGGVTQRVVIEVQTVITPGGGAPVVNLGGLLAQPSNIGVFERSKFTFVPSLTVNLKYHVNPCLNFFIGYNLILINDVALSGDQIDLRVNLNQPVGPALPAFTFRDTDYWIQGMNFGVGWDF